MNAVITNEWIVKTNFSIYRRKTLAYRWTQAAHFTLINGRDKTRVPTRFFATMPSSSLLMKAGGVGNDPTTCAMLTRPVQPFVRAYRRKGPRKHAPSRGKMNLRNRRYVPSLKVNASLDAVL